MESGTSGWRGLVGDDFTFPRVRETTIWNGLRLDFEGGSWLLMRPSGTEPEVRYYVEARPPADLEALTQDGKIALLS